MQQFTETLLAALKNKPGLTKERLAQAMNAECDQEFRNALSEAYDTGLIHKVQDKYYPGSLKSY
jgi:hypothetical protein